MPSPETNTLLRAGAQTACFRLAYQGVGVLSPFRLGINDWVSLPPGRLKNLLTRRYLVDGAVPPYGPESLDYEAFATAVAENGLFGFRWADDTEEPPPTPFFTMYSGPIEVFLGGNLPASVPDEEVGYPMVSALISDSDSDVLVDIRVLHSVSE